MPDEIGGAKEEDWVAHSCELTWSAIACDLSEVD